MAQKDAELHLADLAWARELVVGNRDALARYESELVPMVEAKLRRRGFTDDQIAEVQQVLRARLLVGTGEGPAIGAYEGRARLSSWVQVAALREAVRVRSKQVREPAVEDDALIALADRADRQVDAPEKEPYRRAFREAFRAALSNLPPRERTLLRLNVIDELSIDAIAALHDVHRATAARWLESAREAVSMATRRELARSLGIDPFEASELMHWVRSQIDLSLSGLARG
ncbi:MAG: sigma-70 family RNA polymerase sigma factor [Myxococcales bacterium]|nr:sigma-70 family RNA polymerase sigma factor [Myxococcales bacterium]